MDVSSSRNATLRPALCRASSSPVARDLRKKIASNEADDVMAE
jgi:hypothetical protein